MWDPHTRQLVATLYDRESLNDSLGWSNTLAFTPDSRQLVAGGHHVGLWNLDDARPITTATIGSHGQDEALAVAISPSGNLLAVGEQSRTHLRCFSLVADQIQPFEGCLVSMPE